MVEKIKLFFKRIIVRIVILMVLANSLSTTNVLAADTPEESDEGGGGVLLTPIFNLIEWIDDSVFSLLQSNLLTNEQAIIDGKIADEPIAGKILGIVGGVLLIAGSVALTIATGGIASPVLATMVGWVSTGMLVGGVILGGVNTYNLYQALHGSYELPNIAYTPYAIFSGQIPLMRADFFGKDNGEVLYEVSYSNGETRWYSAKSEAEAKEQAYEYQDKQNEEANKKEKEMSEEKAKETTLSGNVTGEVDESKFSKHRLAIHLIQVCEKTKNCMELSNSTLSEGKKEEIKKQCNNIIKQVKSLWYRKDFDSVAERISFSNYDEYVKLEDEAIFDGYKDTSGDTGRIEVAEITDVSGFLWDCQYFYSTIISYDLPDNLSPGNVQYWGIEDIPGYGDLASNIDGEKEKENKEKLEEINNSKIYVSSVRKRETAGDILRNLIKGWYLTLRNVAIVGLLTVLVYIGIRILLTSISSDKAKYKKMLKDWVIALCMVVMLHYIMVFVTFVTERVVGMFAQASTENLYHGLPKSLEVDLNDDGDKERLETNHVYVGKTDIAKFEGNIVDGEIPSGDNVGAFYLTNFVGYIRLETNLYSSNAKAGILGLIMYTVLTIQTCIFTVKYLKRVFILAFLTVISPLIALTYPLDKIKDGTAQAFTFWIREYVFNSITPIIHMLIYCITVSAAYELAYDHPIFALIALGAMNPMEQLIRKMFSFEKSSTSTTMSSIMGAGLVMNGLNKVAGIGAGSSNGAKGNGGTNSSSGESIWTKNKSDSGSLDDLIFGGSGDDGGGSGGGALGNVARGLGGAARGIAGGIAGGVGNVARSAAGGAGNAARGAAGGIGNVARGAAGRAGNAARGAAGGVGNALSRGNAIGNAVRQTTTLRGRLGNARNMAIRGARSLGNGVRTGGQRLASATRPMRGRSRNALQAAGRRFVRNNIVGRNPVKSLAKLGLRAAGTAVGAGIGLAAGIATGDLGKTAQYTVAGGNALGKFANNMANKVDNTASSYKETMEEAYHYDDTNYWNNKRVQEFNSDENNMRELNSQFNSQEMRRIRREVLPTAVGEHGIHDVKDIAAISKMVINDGMDVERATTIAEAANKIGKLDTAKQQSEANDTLVKKFGEKLNISSLQEQTNADVKGIEERAKAEAEQRAIQKQAQLDKYKRDKKRQAAIEKKYKEDEEKIKAQVQQQINAAQQPLKERRQQAQEYANTQLDIIKKYWKTRS